MTNETKWKPSGPDVLFGLLTIPFHLLWDSWVTATLYRWFIVPLGAPTLRWQAFIGIGLFVGLVTARWRPDATSEDEWYSRLAWCFMAPLTFLVFGFVVRGLFS